MAWTGVQALVKTYEKLVNEFVSKTNNEFLWKIEKGVEKETGSVLSEITSSISSSISIKKKKSRQRQLTRKRS